MRSAAVAVVVVLLACVLAGCTGGKAADPTAKPAGATATTGIIRGIVVDNAIRPLPGVAIAAQGQGGLLNTTTGTDGIFSLGGLEPGVYLVTASKPYHTPQQLAIDVRAGVEEPDLAKFQLTFEARSVPYAAIYKAEGFHECGTNILRVCSNINIATWIVVCSNTHGAVCLGNVTSDHSLFLQYIDGAPTFIQSELSWESTTDTGRALSLLIGGANGTELNAGMAYAYNGTEGMSPLMLRLSNHEADDNWCVQNIDPPCRTPDTLNYTGIGTTRALLVQVDAGATYPTDNPTCGSGGPCGAGFSAQQPFTMFTTVFYGYEPPLDWLFSTTGQPPSPPS